METPKKDIRTIDERFRAGLSDYCRGEKGTADSIFFVETSRADEEAHRAFDHPRTEEGGASSRVFEAGKIATQTVFQL